MTPICLIVAGIVRATLPITEFALAWDHSVEQTRWEEHYRLDGNRLVLVEARVKSFGAGMEPPSSSVLRNGWWTWHPQTPLAELKLTLSSYTRDYTLCWRDRCAALRALAGPINDGDVVVIRRCAAASASAR